MVYNDVIIHEIQHAYTDSTSSFVGIYIPFVPAEVFTGIFSKPITPGLQQIAYPTILDFCETSPSDVDFQQKVVFVSASSRCLFETVIDNAISLNASGVIMMLPPNKFATPIYDYNGTVPAIWFGTIGNSPLIYNQTIPGLAVQLAPDTRTYTNSTRWLWGEETPTKNTRDNWVPECTYNPSSVRYV